MSKREKIIIATVPTLITLTVSLFVAVVVLAGLYVQERNRVDVDISQSMPIANIGAYAYSFEGDRAIPVSSEETDSLLAVLVERADREAQSGCQSAYYTVRLMNEERNQALLGYGCGSPDSPMHAVYEDGAWDLISPTNKFDTLSIPACEYVDEHDLSFEVAPVCHSHTEESQSYTAR